MRVRGEADMRKTIACGIVLALGCGLVCGGTAAFAGLVPGKLEIESSFDTEETHQYKVRLKGGEQVQATAVTSGEEGGDIDMSVWDANNEKVTDDFEADSVPVCVWTPPRTGEFTIRVINNAQKPVSYVFSIE